VAAIRFVLLALVTFLVVAVRRLFKGPLHSGWSYRYEAIIELLRKSLAGSHGVPVTAMRRSIPGARIHPTILPSIRHERGTFAGLRSETVTPSGWTEAQPTVLYLHGGGYIVCSPATHRDLVSRIAVASGARCIAVDYRKAPEHPFPLPVEDAEAAYRALLDSGVSASRVFVAGDSAGGGLTLALLQRVRDSGLPMPRAAILLSPWVDLECTGESIQKNAPFDYLPAANLSWGVDQYLQGGDRRHPHASAVHADLRGLPPLLVVTGGAELFLSENLRLVEQTRDAGVRVTHQVEAGMVHVFPAFASFLPECAPVIDRIGAFVREHHTAA